MNKRRQARALRARSTAKKTRFTHHEAKGPAQATWSGPASVTSGSEKVVCIPYGQKRASQVHMERESGEAKRKEKDMKSVETRTAGGT